MHTDVCGPFDIQTRGGYLYFTTFTDDFSWYRFVYLMQHKSEAFEKFKEFRCEVEKHVEKLIKIFRSDQGEKYFNKRIMV